MSSCGAEHVWNECSLLATFLSLEVAGDLFLGSWPEMKVLKWKMTFKMSELRSLCIYLSVSYDQHSSSQWCRMGHNWETLFTEYPCEKGNNHLLDLIGGKKMDFVLEEGKWRTLEIMFKNQNKTTHQKTNQPSHQKKQQPNPNSHQKQKIAKPKPLVIFL